MKIITEYFYRFIRFALLMNSNCKTEFSWQSFISLLVTQCFPFVWSWIISFVHWILNVRKRKSRILEVKFGQSKKKYQTLKDLVTIQIGRLRHQFQNLHMIPCCSEAELKVVYKTILKLVQRVALTLQS